MNLHALQVSGATSQIGSKLSHNCSYTAIIPLAVTVIY